LKRQAEANWHPFLRTPRGVAQILTAKGPPANLAVTLCRSRVSVHHEGDWLRMPVCFLRTYTIVLIRGRLALPLNSPWTKNKACQ